MAFHVGQSFWGAAKRKPLTSGPRMGPLCSMLGFAFQWAFQHPSLIHCLARIGPINLLASQHQGNRCGEPPDGLNGTGRGDRIRQTHRRHEDGSNRCKADGGVSRLMETIWHDVEPNPVEVKKALEMVDA